MFIDIDFTDVFVNVLKMINCIHSSLYRHISKKQPKRVELF